MIKTSADVVVHDRTSPITVTGGMSIKEESELAQAKIKGLDDPGPVVTKPVRKDVNTFINNQLKFSGGQPSALPPSQMKCNILKAKNQDKNGQCVQELTSDPPLYSLLIWTSFIFAAEKGGLKVDLPCDDAERLVTLICFV